VTSADATPSGTGSSAMAYEQLRSDVLEGGSAGGHFGLVVLLREGLAAFMARGSAQPESAMRGSVKQRLGTRPIVSDEIHGAMVDVLASMAMAIPQEMCA
jgi:hypothetical protein